MRNSKLVSLVLVLLVVCMLCTSCFGREEEPDETTVGGTTTAPIETTTPTPTTPGTTPAPIIPGGPDASDEPAPEDMPHDDPILLGGVNLSSYKIVYGRSQMEKKYNSNSNKTAWEDLMNSGIENYENMLQGENKEAEFDYETAIRLRDLIKARFNIELEVVKDADAPNASRYEILVGYTDRPATATITATLKIDQFYLGLNSGVENVYATQYLIVGGSYGATWHALDEIEKLAPMPATEDAQINITAENNTVGAYRFKTVATIGDSITRGSQAFPDGNSYGAANGFAQKIAGSATGTYLEKFLSWPSVLQRELWKDYLICNYGQGYATMIDDTKDIYPDSGPYYYNDLQKFANLLAESDRDDFDFDLVLIMLGTNDAGRAGGAAKWKDGNKDEFMQEAENLLRKISKGSPDATFVFMNAPHRCDGNANSEANDAAIRELQKLTAKRMIQKGYSVLMYDMERYTVENLTADGMTCAEKKDDAAGKTTAALLEEEKVIHGDYYNIKTDTGSPDTTHPNYRGYGKIAEGMKDLLLHFFEGAEAPEYMIDPLVETPAE